jgi:integrase
MGYSITSVISLESIKPTDRRQEVPDAKVRGLYYVLQPSGAASWALRYRSNGKPVKLTLGSYPALGLADARRAAQKALGDVAGGSDPAAEKRAARDAQKAAQHADEMLFANVAESYLQRHVRANLKSVWAHEVERHVRVELVPVLGAKRIDEVTRANVADLLDDIKARGAPVAANRVHGTLRGIYLWAIERGIVSVSPVSRKPPTTEMSRERTLTDVEIKRVWKALDKIGGPFAAAAKLMLLTGQRRTECAEIEWREFDLEQKTWTLPGDRAKNGKVHEIPLSDAVCDLLRKQSRHERNKHVFTTGGGLPVRGWSKFKEDVDKVCAVDDWTWHDLRRTMATNLQRLGVRLEVTESILNHTSGSRAGVIGIYQRHSWTEEKRQALDAWARHLDEIITGRA